MADLSDFYSNTGVAGAPRPTQAPQGGTSAVGGNFSVSGGLNATSIDIWGFLGLLAVAFFVMHLE